MALPSTCQTGHRGGALTRVARPWLMPNCRPAQGRGLDVSLPGRQRGQGGLHPVSLTLERIEGIFGSMGLTWRRPRDRDRLVQLHRAEHAGRPSGAFHARHVLRGGRHATAPTCCARTPARCRFAMPCST